METEQSNNNGISDTFILNNFLSVSRIIVNIGIIAIENLRNNNVVGSIPFCVNVRTNIPLDPNSAPAIIGSIRCIFFISIS